MILPPVPTDNLYKFLFIAGLSIIGASSLLFVDKYAKITDKLDQIELSILNHEANNYSDSLAMAFELERISTLARSDSAKSIRLKQIDTTRRSTINTKENEIEELFSRTQSKLWEARALHNNKKVSSRKEKHLTNHKLAQLKRANIYFVFIAIFCGLSFMIGLILTLCGYRQWKQKVQVPLDEKIRLELKSLRSQ